MTVELASAYVSIIPTTKGLQSGLEKELSPLTGAASKAGTDSGKALGSSFTSAGGGLKAGVGEAEGAIGGFKAKATSALDSVGISSGMLGVVGGAALAGFAVHAVNAFTSTAKAALDMGAATGLSVEDASRWIALGDDYEISAGTMTSSLGKIAKTLDTGKWSDYGIATRDAGGNARDTNDILLDTFQKLGQIPEGAERATAGNALFGKGYSNLAPLIGKTREEMEKYLGSVEKGQVITAAEAAKAEKLRLAQDALKDSLGEVTLALGGMASAFSPVLTLVAKGVTLVANLIDKWNTLVMATKDTTDATKAYISSTIEQHKGTGNVIADFKQLINVQSDARSGLDKTAGFFDNLLGMESDADQAAMQFNITFEQLAKNSPQAAEQVATAFDQLKTAADAGDPSAQKLLASYNLTTDSLANLHTIAAGYGAQQEANTATTIESAAAVDAAKKADDAYTKGLQDAAAALQAEADAQNGMIDAMHASIDTQYAVKDATDTYDTYLKNLSKSVRDAKGDQSAINAIYREGASDADKIATSVAAAYAEAEKGAGITQTATEKLDLWNQSMVTSAQKASPDLRAEIMTYIGTVNNIPPEKMTEINAAIAAGDLETANTLLTAASGARSVAITADADTSQATLDLNAATLPRPLTVTPYAVGWKDPMLPWRIPVAGKAGGGPASGLILAGENGPELINLGQGSSYVHTAAATRSMMSSTTMALAGNSTSTPFIGTMINQHPVSIGDLNHLLAMSRLAS